VAALNFLVPREYLLYLQAATIPLFSAGRVPQILQNFRNRSTGQLALLSYLLAFAGSLARVFTTLQQANNTTRIIIIRLE
jgi:mannose-P-dolichol utilization defect 1